MKREKQEQKSAQRHEGASENDGLGRLLAVMARLRDPEHGCPWDLEQDFASLAPYTLEEAYEVVEALEEGDPDHLREELGDLLLQIVFHAQIAQEQGLFSFEAIAAQEAQKMIDRHPHVFGDRKGVASASDVLRNWEADKASQKAENAKKEEKPHSLLDGISTALPALIRAEKIHKRIAHAGFDWENSEEIIKKMREEIDEIEAETRSGAKSEALALEIGDLISVAVNLARHAGIDPETALRATNRKIERRIRWMEDSLRQRGLRFQDASLEEKEALWAKAKKADLPIG